LVLTFKVLEKYDAGRSMYSSKKHTIIYNKCK